MLKISDFAKKTGVSEKTLRYYDSIDLLKPKYCDDFTGYRYYLIDQVKTIKKINLFKDLGLSLNEIKNYIENPNNQILIDKKEEYENKMKEIDKMLKEIDDKKNYEVIECNYDKYIEINGILSADKIPAIDIKENQARYFVIYKNDEFYDDFVINNDGENWITLNPYRYTDKDLLDAIVNCFDKNNIKFFKVYIAIDNGMVVPNLSSQYEAIKEYFKNINETIEQTGNGDYKKIIINI